jgi:hypothetical protein
MQLDFAAGSIIALPINHLLPNGAAGALCVLIDPVQESLWLQLHHE